MQLLLLIKNASNMNSKKISSANLRILSFLGSLVTFSGVSLGLFTTSKITYVIQIVGVGIVFIIQNYCWRNKVEYTDVFPPSWYSLNAKRQVMLAIGLVLLPIAIYFVFMAYYGL
jgi:hypothetical protein